LIGIFLKVPYPLDDGVHLVLVKILLKKDLLETLTLACDHEDDPSYDKFIEEFLRRGCSLL
jgi:hypothetical protein